MELCMQSTYKTTLEVVCGALCTLGKRNIVFEKKHSEDGFDFVTCKEPPCEKLVNCMKEL